MNGYGAHNLDWQPDVVVVGNVQTKDHIEVKAAQERKLKLTSFPALLEELFLARMHSIVVAGTHGKTTTSSLAAFVLTDAGRDPSFLVGGVPVNFGRSWRPRQGRPVRRRGRRVRHRVLRQGIEVPALPAEDRDHHQRRARPRRHLHVARRGQGRVPQVRRAHPAPTGCASSPPTRRARSTSPGAPRCKVETYVVRDAEHPDAQADWIGARHRHARRRPHAVRGHARRQAVRRVRHHAARRLQPGQRAVGDRRLRRPRPDRRADRHAACAASPACAAARRCAASPRASPSSTTSRTTRRRCARRCARCAAVTAAGG